MKLHNHKKGFTPAPVKSKSGVPHEKKLLHKQCVQGSQKKSAVRGFTFLEVIVATFIFVIAMVMISQLFGSGYLGFKKSRSVQQDLEAAQQAINIMAKTLRTSAVIEPDVEGDTTTIKILDYSRSANNCIIYEFFGGTDNVLRVGSTSIDLDLSDDPVADCDASSFTASQNMTSGRVNGSFYVVPNNPTGTPRETGRLVISMRVCLKESCTTNPKDEARIQTTVSLRNYRETN